MMVMMKGLVLILIVGACAQQFPSDFKFGSATAAYQIEGAWNESKGLSIWDVFTHTSGKITNNDTGDVAVDNYHRYLEDIALMKSLGLKNYRMSLSWPRIFPNGYGDPNPAGVQHYNDLIDALLANGIEPFVTLYHWDAPQAIDGAWLNSSISDYFAAYANASFAFFGDRVKSWLTLNEPWTFCHHGYSAGVGAPGRCSDRTYCAEGDSFTEPYTCGHNVLLSHAKAVDIYRKYYKSSQNGTISITLNCDWAIPFNDTTESQDAAQRFIDWMLGWFADPIFLGDYPQSMKDKLGSRLPTLPDDEKALIKGSWDFFGLNHYTTGYAINDPNPDPSLGMDADSQVDIVRYRDGQIIGAPADSPWLFVVPYGIRAMLNYIANRYGNPPVYITENGVSVPNENNIPLPDVLHDQFRVDFYSQYIGNVSAAISDGVDVRGYFAWSLMDNFEWGDGYTKRFGLIYVDYDNNLTRHVKDSAIWFSNYTQTALANPPPTSSSTLGDSSNNAPSLASSCALVFIMLFVVLIR